MNIQMVVMQHKSFYLILFATTQLAAEILGPCVSINDECRPRAIWEQPLCPECHGRVLECAIIKVKPYGYVTYHLT